MTKRLIVFFILLAVSAWSADGEWKTIFDGKTLNGWKANEDPGAWTVCNGAITGDGDRSHLFYMEEQCENCEFKAEVKISDAGNSGMYFRAEFGPGWPKGYEAQVNATHTDWKKTGSLYNFVNIKEQLAKPGEWYTQHIIAKGNHIIIKVNDKTVVDYVDEKNSFMKGYVAFQQHNKGSVVQFRNVQLRRLD